MGDQVAGKKSVCLDDAKVIMEQSTQLPRDQVLGQRLAVGKVSRYCEVKEGLLAHVTCTYALPPDSSRPKRLAADGDADER